MDVLLLVAYSAMSLAGGDAASPNMVSECGVVLEAPPGWSAGPRALTPEGKCAFRVGPPEAATPLADADDPNAVPQEFWVRVSKETIASVVESEMVERDNDGWYFVGRWNLREPAKEIHTACCLAVVGGVEAGRYGPEGYRGMGLAPLAFVFGEHQTAELFANPAAVDADVFERAAGSLVFGPNRLTRP